MGADLIRIEKDGHIIEATERAYEVVYKFRGYKPAEETNKGKKQVKDK